MAQDPDIRWLTLTADGETTLGIKIRNRGTMLVLLSGTFGSGTVVGGYLDDTGTFQPFVGAEFTTAIATQMELPAGSNLELALDLTGSTGASIKIGYVADTFQLP